MGESNRAVVLAMMERLLCGQAAASIGGDMRSVS